MAGRRKASSPPSHLTPLEVQVMQVLWRDGPGNVQQVQQQIAGDLAYTTIQTVLNGLLQKGKVRRTLEGRAFEYRAAVARSAVLRNAVKDFVDRMFSGSSEELVMSLIKTKQLDAKKIAALAAAEQESPDE
jgi:BlaI family transcriptional regulator, penicillinase repressor